jgi:hypothetical protein
VIIKRARGYPSGIKAVAAPMLGRTTHEVASRRGTALDADASCEVCRRSIGRNVIVIGAGPRIGRAVAARFADEGAAIALIGVWGAAGVHLREGHPPDRRRCN